MARDLPELTNTNPLGARMVLRIDGQLEDHGLPHRDGTWNLAGFFGWFGDETIWAEQARWVGEKLRSHEVEVLVVHELLYRVNRRGNRTDSRFGRDCHIVVALDRESQEVDRLLQEHLFAPSGFHVELTHQQLQQLWDPQHPQQTHRLWHRYLRPQEATSMEAICPLYDLEELLLLDLPAEKRPKGGLRTEALLEALQRWPWGGREERRRNLAARLLGNYQGQDLLDAVNALVD